MTTVLIPTMLRTYTGDRSSVDATGATVRAVIDDLESRHRGLRAKVLDEQGALRRYVNVYVGDEDVRSTGGLDTPVGDRDEVAIIPSVAGG